MLTEKRVDHVGGLVVPERLLRALALGVRHQRSRKLVQKCVIGGETIGGSRQRNHNLGVDGPHGGQHLFADSIPSVVGEVIRRVSTKLEVSITTEFLYFLSRHAQE